MHLLYCDESGGAPDASQKYFVLAGISVFEREGYWLSNKLDDFIGGLNLGNPQDIELHGSPMLKGRGMWRRVPVQARVQAIMDALTIFRNSHPANRLFVCVIEKAKASPRDAVELAFEQLAVRFDHYLMRLHRLADTQRGLIVFDKSTYETTIQRLARDFRTIGHSWGVLRNLAEVPLFIDSQASRLTQLADLVAYAFFRKYERGESRFADVVESRFDMHGGIRHGLFEL